MAHIPPSGSPVVRAERRLLEAEERVEAQRQLIAKLERDNPHDVPAAYRVLAALEEALFLARTHRDQVRDRPREGSV